MPVSFSTWSGSTPLIEPSIHVLCVRVCVCVCMCGDIIQQTLNIQSHKGVYREEGMQLTLFSESSDFVLSYF